MFGNNSLFLCSEHRQLATQAAEIRDSVLRLSKCSVGPLKIVAVEQGFGGLPSERSPSYV